MNGSYAIMTHRMLQIGDQFDRFQIEGHLAQGGMSEIYRAFDVVNRVEVALKLPETSMIGDPAQYERFQREIEVVRFLIIRPCLRDWMRGGSIVSLIWRRSSYKAIRCVKLFGDKLR